MLKVLIIIFSICLYIFVATSEISSQWITLNKPEGQRITDYYNCGGTLVVYCNQGGVGKTVFKSINNGYSWVNITNSLPVNTSFVTKNIVYLNNDIYISFYDHGIYKSTNLGSSWVPLNSPRGNNIRANNQNLYIYQSRLGTDSLYLSSNFGSTWISKNLPLNGYKYLWVNTNYILLGGYNEGNSNASIFYSSNDGDSWTNIPLPISSNLNFYLALYNNEVYFFHEDGNLNYKVFKTTDFGMNWTNISYNVNQLLTISGIDFEDVRISNEGIFVGTDWKLLFKSYSENSWHNISYNSGELLSINSLFVFNDSLFINSSFGVNNYKHAINNLISVQNITTNIPTNFSLEQNYPNPFNPITSIEFNLPVNSLVKIAVFNVEGKEVSEIVNEKLSSGKYKVNFDGTAYSSGIYFYQLVADKIFETRRMILLK